MKIILSILVLFVAYSVLAQKPRFVPFQYQNEIGIMDVEGNEFVGTGVFGDYMVVGDFQAYIVRDQVLTNKDFFFNALSGTGMGDIDGTLDRACGALAVGDLTYYHFWMDGTSVMASYGKESIFLPKRYLKIEPNIQAWDNENLSEKHFVWALNEDDSYDLLLPEQGFKVVRNLPDFTSYDIVFSSSKAGAMKLRGFVLGSRQTIKRDFGQMYEIPPSDGSVTVFDTEFKKLGTSAYRKNDISALFKEEVQLRGSILPPPQLANRVIYATGKTVILNDEFSLVPDTADKDRLVLVRSKKNNESVLGPGDFDYRYFSTRGNPKALLQIRHLESGSIFFFDFDGTFFPRGVPMIPKSKMAWTSNLSKQ
ncbi:hypothetical protein GCM10027051_30530 [Niabella terrae]